MKKFILGTIAVLAVGAASAHAADLPVRPPPPVKAPPMMVLVYSWTGCFIGGNGGGLWAKKHWNATAPDSFPQGAEFSSQSPSSWMAGGQLGCDYQFNTGNGGFVIGIQGDYDWVNAKASAHDALRSISVSVTDETTVKSLGSVTGRLGYAWDRFLLYARGGYAWERDNYRMIVTITGSNEATASETRGGWTVGGGAEYAFTNWLTGFVEYDYYDFGHRTNNFIATGSGTVFDVVDIRERKQIVKAGLNLRFGSGPVVARY